MKGPVLNQSSTYLTYQKSRFSTRLPKNRVYTAAHFWIQEVDGRQRVGLTKFATRMLGDLVETGFEVKSGGSVSVGEVIGWIEGLKAASDLFCVVNGSFYAENPELNENPEWLHKDPYEKGWLYEATGSPEPNATDAQGYTELLDEIIKKMTGE